VLLNKEADRTISH